MLNKRLIGNPLVKNFLTLAILLEINYLFQHRALLAFQAYNWKKTSTESVDTPPGLRYIYQQIYQYLNFILLFPFVFLLEYFTEIPTFYLLAGGCLFFILEVEQALVKMIIFCYRD